MANLGETLNALFTNVGIDNANDALKQLVTKVATIDVDDALVSTLNQNYLTLNSAKNNPELKKHFYAAALNGLDTELENTANELGLDATLLEELKAEKSSYKRASMLVKKVKDLEASKASASKSDKAEIQAKIDGLNNEIVRLKSETETKVKEVESTYKAKLNDFALNNVFGGYEYALPTSKDASIQLARTLFNQELTKKGYKLELDGNEFKLFTTDGLEPHENNKKVTFKDFTDGVLSQHKLLKVADSNNGQQQQQRVIPNAGAKANKYLQALEKQQADISQTYNT
jgi:hypothetical protein